MGYIELRSGRRSITGQVYLVTFITARRHPHFHAWTVASDAARLLSSPGTWAQSRLLAWMLMPDHWHGLVVLGQGDTLSRCVGRAKGTSARRLRQVHEGLGPTWGNGYQDRALRKDDDVATAARYVLMNPVRAGLVQRVGDYPYWDAIWVGTARG
jgi:REP element-mobilizing transposase RayT